ncbi:MAG: hypothetical protein R3Y13_02570 [bacterium]
MTLSQLNLLKTNYEQLRISLQTIVSKNEILIDKINQMNSNYSNTFEIDGSVIEANLFVDSRTECEVQNNEIRNTMIPSIATKILEIESQIQELSVVSSLSDL